MSEIKPKLILRPGLNISDKSPSPSTKLMINHGKPNFTINRSKSKIDTPPPTTPEASQIVLKSTTFNGFIKPSNLNLSTENEVNKVVLRPTKIPEASEKQSQEVEPEFLKVLRRTKLPETNGKPAQEDEPEFIKTQRKIAERLAKENNLDFETRKSGYFTHVMMSPTSPTKPMELPVVEPAKIQKATVLDATLLDTAVSDATVLDATVSDATVSEAAVTDTTELVQPTETAVEESKPMENGRSEETVQNGHQEEEKQTVPEVEVQKEDVKEDVKEEPKEEVKEEVQTESDDQPEPDVTEIAKTLVEEVVQNVPEVLATQNGDANQPQENGTAAPTSNVNFEPKTVVSFSKELSSEPNKYPDTVKVVQQVEPIDADQSLLQEMSKLKFDITADSDDVTVTPVLRAAE